MNRYTSMFNDPFDCSVPLRYDILPKGKIIERSRTLVKYDNPNFNRRKVRQESKSRLKPGYYKNKNFQLKFQKDYKDRNFGIYSLAAEPDHIVMWAHYSDAHQGFCVGLNTEKLVEFMRKIFKNNGPLIDLLPVIYQKEYPLLDPSQMDNQEYVIQPLRIKSQYWKYENEYRLISINRTKFSIQLPIDIYSEIILGCQISKEHKIEIKSVIKERFPDVKLYYAEMEEDNFSLRFNHIKFGRKKSHKA